MEHTFETFYEAAIKEFGKDNLSLSGFSISEDDALKFNKEHKSNLSVKDFEEYKAIWIIDEKCPRCKADLGGLFGSFEWGIVHGSGRCSNCRKVSIKYYHYIKDCKQPILGFSLIGF